MNSKSLILLRAMFMSTSRINALKHTTDKKIRKKHIGAIVGAAVLAVYGAVMVGLIAGVMAGFGFKEAVPGMVASVITIMSLVFTLLKSNGYLYGFKEYDMIMAMPFSVNEVVSDRFLFMYLRDLRWDTLISLSALVGYAIAVRPTVLTYVLWILLTPFIPLVPTVISALLGVLVARIGSRSKHRNVIQIVLIYIFVIPMFFIQYIINYIIGSDKVDDVLSSSSDLFAGISKAIPTVGWFGKAINETDVLSAVLLLAVSLIIYVGAVILIGKSYRRINSNLAGFEVKRNAKKQDASGIYKKKPLVWSIAYKEFKRITGSTTCATNICMGMVMAVLVGVILLFVKIDSVILLFTHGHPADVTPYRLIWPFIVYFFVGMVPSTAPSPSLEGKNDWIIKTMPIDEMTVCRGRMLFNLCLTLPAGLFAVLSGCHAMKGGIVDYLISIYLIVVLVLFSTVYGMKCGLKHVKLDWENEVEVVKSGPAVNTYVLPNLFGTMIVIALMIVLSFIMDLKLLVLIVSALYIILTLWSYARVRKLAHI